MKTISVDCLCCRKYGKQNVEPLCYLHTDLSDPEISTIYDVVYLPAYLLLSFQDTNFFV